MRRIHRGEQLSVFDYRCTAARGDRPFAEHHATHSVSYVRKGAFGLHTRGRSHDLVAGSIMLGHPGDEYTCSHEHMAGDECLSISLGPELAETLTPSSWRTAALPPLAELVVLGQLAEAAAAGGADGGVDELAVQLVARAASVAGEVPDDVPRIRPVDRRRMIDIALWIDADSREAIGLEAAAREAALSPFHFLRTFRAVLGVTPHQYLIRCRLRHAARLLAEGDLPITAVALEVGFNDLSNFVKTFRRAAGVTPREYRRAAAQRQHRKIAQDRSHGGPYGRRMIDHIGIPVADICASVRFYTAALAPLGLTLEHQDEDGASFGAALYLTRAGSGAGAPAHVAFSAAEPDAVDRFHSEGRGAGGRDNGAPGDRPDYGEHYYAAYLLDPDGHNVEAVCTTA